MWSGAVGSAHHLREAGRAAFPLAARNNYCSSARANISPAPQTPPAGSAGGNFRGFARNESGEERGRGGGGARAAKRGLKSHQQSGAFKRRSASQIEPYAPW